MPADETAASALTGLVHGDPVTIVGGKYAGKAGAFCGLTPQRVRVAIDGKEKAVALTRRFVVPNVAKRLTVDSALGLADREDGSELEMNGSGPTRLRLTRVHAIASDDDTEAETDEDDVYSDAAPRSMRAVSPEPVSGFDALANAVGSNRLVHTHLNGRRVDHIVVSDSSGDGRPDKYTFAFRLFGHRLLNIRMKITAITKSVPPTFEERGGTYELLLTSVEKAGSQQFPSNELHATYVLTSGGGLPPIDLRDTLEEVAGFGALPPEKTPARLELLGSKVRKSTLTTRGKDGYLAFELSAPDDFELIDDSAHEGCGFVPKSFVHKFLGDHAVGKRTFAIQVRVYSPRLGVFKGMLLEKRGITKIQLPTSMMKVGPSSQSRDDWAVLTMTSIGVFPSATNVTIANIRQSGKIPKSFTAKSRKPSPMIENVWLDSGLSQSMINDYSKDCKHPKNLMHASLVGLKDPTGAIPAGHVFVTGNKVVTDDADRVYVTRFPCTNAGDGFVLPIVPEKKKFRQVEYDSVWLRAAQDKMADVVSIKNLQVLVGKLHTQMENSAGAEREAFGAAYKEAIDIGKHGGKVHLPVRMYRRRTKSTTRAGASNSALHSLPSLVVFDLDNTLWTPELYQLRKIARANQYPVAHKDVKLFPAAKEIVEQIRNDKEGRFSNTKFAVASRTKSVDWAHDLLDQFGLRDVFDHVEIFPGDKKQHFSNLKSASGIEYKDMLFFDDSRDGRYGNCEPVSHLGVLSVHCPNGIYEEAIWANALSHYKEWSAHKTPGTIVEWDNTVTTQKAADPNERHTGEVKFINREKRFGFIQYGGRGTRDMFFHFNALPYGQEVEEGDELSFTITMDKRNGKDAAANIELSKSDADGSDLVSLRTFSMNLPFAALLANGYKTLETRNGTMFTPYQEGTKMLLHVGQRTYPDGNRHLEVMRSGGLDDAEIADLKSLPKGFTKGMAVAIVELGKTYETTLEQRCDPDFQRAVAAFGSDSGMRATEIKRVEYLKRGVKVSGQGGVFKAKVNKDAIPPGWLDDEGDAMPSTVNGKKQKVFYSATF
ncbi:hypothetical protein ACHAXT_006906 [Thalassiosira profunda]